MIFIVASWKLYGEMCVLPCINDRKGFMVLSWTVLGWMVEMYVGCGCGCGMSTESCPRWSIQCAGLHQLKVPLHFLLNHLVDQGPEPTLW